MKKILCLVSFFISSHLLASDEFRKFMDEEFGFFATIDHALLEKAINTIPSQSTLWGCGLHQVGHTLVCAGKECALDFSVPGDYPLSLDVDCKKDPILSMFLFRIVTDNGVFRVGATPRDIGLFLNDKLADTGIKSCVKSVDQLDKKEFIEIINTNIKHLMPTLAYYVIDAQKMLMHIYAVVGYSDDKVLVLDTNGNGRERLKTIAIDEFINKMNAQSIINLVALVNNDEVRNRVQTIGGRVATKESLTEWKAYSLVGFIKDEPNKMPADLDLD